MSDEQPMPAAWSPLKTGLAVVVALGVMIGLWLNVAPQQEQAEPERYAVVKGDTLSAIARRYHVSVEQLRGWNDIEGDLIEVGQELIIWTELGSAPPTGRQGDGKRRGTIRSSNSGVATLASPNDALLPLVMPPERPCLQGPTAADLGDPEDEPAFAASAGLDEHQLRIAMNAFLPRLGRCVTGDDWPTAVVDTELTVACTGRVAEVTITDPGGLDPAMVACIADALRYVPFPAHDMPDGFTFRYPIRFSG